MRESEGKSVVMTTDRDRAYWERHAKNYDRSMALLGRPIPRMLVLVGEAVRGAERVLEVAAGTGLVTTTLAREAKEVVATDYAAEMVTMLEAKIRDEGLTNVRCEQADIYALSYEARSFDVVVAANVLHLVPDLQGALVALRRVLKPGGRLVVPTFCHDENRLSRLVSRVLALSRFPGHRRFTTQTLRESLGAAGLRVGRGETLPGLLPIGYIEAMLAE